MLPSLTSGRKRRLGPLIQPGKDSLVVEINAALEQRYALNRIVVIEAGHMTSVGYRLEIERQPRAGCPVFYRYSFGIGDRGVVGTVYDHQPRVAARRIIKRSANGTIRQAACHIYNPRQRGSCNAVIIQAVGGNQSDVCPGGTAPKGRPGSADIAPGVQSSCSGALAPPTAVYRACTLAEGIGLSPIKR